MRYFISILFLLFTMNVFAEKKLAKDTASISVRTFDVKEYKSKKEFQYAPPVPEPKTLWDRFWTWFWNLIDTILSTENGKTTVNVILVIIGLAIIVFFVVKVTGMNKQNLFAQSNTSIAHAVFEENIHEIDFNSSIEKAMQQNDFALTIRLLYLQSLKLLTDKSVIDWKPEKTNQVYVKEMAVHSLHKKFTEITNVFEQAWYGKQTLSEDEFKETYSLFKNFQQQV